MRHRKDKGRKFGRVKKVRKSMFRSLAVSLIAHERITTTEAKAKELSRIVEPYITRAKEGDIAARRMLARSLPPRTVKKLVDEIGPRFKERRGGYTRITHLKVRQSDSAPLAVIEFV
jgi:large subunit ribosomal protein L17